MHVVKVKKMHVIIVNSCPYQTCTVLSFGEQKQQSWQRHVLPLYSVKLLKHSF